MQNRKVLNYTLLRPLGKGGMAEVWYAENEIGKKAAVKVLLPKFCADEAIVARFQNDDCWSEECPAHRVTVSSFYSWQAEAGHPYG